MALDAVNSLKIGRARLLSSRTRRLSRRMRLGRSLALPLPGIFQRCVSATLICFLLFGCGGRQSDAQRVEKASKSAGLQSVRGYPLGGKLTIDGQPPPSSETAPLLVIAYDSAKSDVNAKGSARASIKPDGSFEFPSLTPGKYVMLFAQFHRSPKMGFLGADGLKNLYNDPDVNAKKPEFLIDHRAPGKTDCTFNLSMAGETPPAGPGSKAFVGSGAQRAP